MRGHKVWVSKFNVPEVNTFNRFMLDIGFVRLYIISEIKLKNSRGNEQCT